MTTETLPPLTIVQVHVSGLYGKLELFQTIGEALDYIIELPDKTQKTGMPLSTVNIVVEYENGDLDRYTRSEVAHAVELLRKRYPADIQM